MATLARVALLPSVAVMVCEPRAACGTATAQVVGAGSWPRAAVAHAPVRGRVSPSTMPVSAEEGATRAAGPVPVVPPAPERGAVARGATGRAVEGEAVPSVVLTGVKSPTRRALRIATAVPWVARDVHALAIVPLLIT